MLMSPEEEEEEEEEEEALSAEGGREEEEEEEGARRAQISSLRRCDLLLNLIFFEFTNPDPYIHY